MVLKTHSSCNLISLGAMDGHSLLFWLSMLGEDPSLEMVARTWHGCPSLLSLKSCWISAIDLGNFSVSLNPINKPQDYVQHHLSVCICC